MSSSTPITASVAPPERQDSRLSEEENQSSGSGSGAGYSADYESSESSLSSKQKNELQQQEEKNNGCDNEKDRLSMATVARGKFKKRKSGDQASSNKSVSSLDNANEQLKALLPQWNGIRISHPMDPRIDLSTVGYTVNSDAAPPASYMMAPHSTPHNNSNSIDHYLGLMEAVRPFFGAYTAVAVPLAAREEPTSDQAPNTGSSEGFTAFFTTTNSNTGTTNTNTSSDSNSDPNAIRNRQARAASQKDDEAEESVSSMVALARVKRKHKQEQHEHASSSPSSSSADEKRSHHRENHGGSPNAEQPLQQPHLGENETKQQQPQQARRQESLSSSSSSDQERQFAVPLPRLPLGNDIHADMNNVPLPLVSESSDANRSNDFSSQSNATASGSGSNGNSGVSNKGSSGSGSGSNNGGSSGSGNEEKGDNSGGNSNSDENNMVTEPIAAAGEPMLGLEQETNDDGSTREDRLMDKKRKRLDMRREYELDMNSSSSDDALHESFSFLPGKPVTLDTALSFSRMARIVIQASPPFLVVHANAAFTRLTGIDSHEVNGRSISNLFTIPSRKGNDGEAQSHQAAAAAGRARAQEETNVERLVIANGFDDYNIIQVAAKLQDVDDDNCDSVQCRMCISPIVARSMPSAVVTDTNQESHRQKKRKHHHHQDEHKNVMHRHQNPPSASNPAHTIITHYVIQLEPDDENRKELTSDGAVLMSKLQQAQHRDQELLNNESSLEETSQSTDPKEAVETVG